MSKKPEKQISAGQLGLAGLLIVLLVFSIYVIKNVLSDEGPRKKTEIATVTLLKPPPPPPPQEKQPEPEPVKEIQKQQEIITPGQVNEPQNVDNDNTPAGDNLGVDAEGGAGGDGFGLVGKKGGRSLLAGGSGMGKMSLLSKFAGYTQMVSNQIRKKVMKHLDDEGGIPKGKLQAVVRLTVNGDGDIVRFSIIGSSGNNRMDDALKEALASMRISELPPDGMPRTMDVKIISQG